MKKEQICYSEIRQYKYRLEKDYGINVGLYPKKDIITDYIILTIKGELFIKKGYLWDGPSGPTIDTPSSMRGSLVHDALYQLMREGLIGQDCRLHADKLLHDICVEDGMNPIRADVWEFMVNDFASYAAKLEKEPEIKLIYAP